MCFAKFCWEQKVARRKRRNPLVRKMLRPAGESLRLKINKLESDWPMLFVIALILPVSSYLIAMHNSLPGHWMLSVVVFGLFAIGLEWWILRRIFTIFNELRNLYLGLEGELATAEELNKLMLAGFRVYHDLPFEYGNIDHVVIGFCGVFAVETKARGKGDIAEGHKVTVDLRNDGLRFAENRVKMPVDQLEINQRWLSQELSKATGLSIYVQSVLALPGYFIEERIGSGRFKVINPVNCKSDFDDGLKRFSEEEVRRIAHQVDRLCRDIKPS